MPLLTEGDFKGHFVITAYLCWIPAAGGWGGSGTARMGVGALSWGPVLFVNAWRLKCAESCTQSHLQNSAGGRIIHLTVLQASECLQLPYFSSHTCSDLSKGRINPWVQLSPTVAFNIFETQQAKGQKIYCKRSPEGIRCITAFTKAS